MKLYSENDNYKLYSGSMLDMLEVIEKESVDSIITDPPYELNFMGKGWDNAGVSFQPDTWKKCFDVLKPGGYLLAFGGTRTFHRIACAIEDAGFEIRDTIMWIYGSGFPKSMNIANSLEGKMTIGSANKKLDGEKGITSLGYNKTNASDGFRPNDYNGRETIVKVNLTTDLAKQWRGWGTALKPSFEPIIVARKPFKGGLIDNVIEYGVGGLNIDECRVAYLSDNDKKSSLVRFKEGQIQDTNVNFLASPLKKAKTIEELTDGRFPANTILTYDETDFDEVCGGFPNTKSQKTNSKLLDIRGNNYNNANKNLDVAYERGYTDSGSASRYFYCAKASKKDRDEGLEEFEEKELNLIGQLPDGFVSSYGNVRNKPLPKKNIHPTVKPTSLMQYLVRLVSPNGATILDPFNGSGSTGKAVMYENKERNKNYKYIGIELTEEYLPISKARIEYVCNLEPEANPQISIFDLDTE